MSNDRQNQVLLDGYKAGITSPAELANYMAQVTHESLDLKRLSEGFKYTQGIDQIPVRSAFRNGRKELEEARLEALQGKPEHLGELMYGGRMGNTDPGDGYKYHGRGYIQLTGKDQYAAAGKALGLDLVNHPELASEPDNASKIAVAYWKANVHGAARENVASATRAINNGDNGLKDRQDRFADWKGKLTPEVMAGLAKGEVALPKAADHHSALRQGTPSESVRELQTKLGQLGYTSADGKPLAADGHMGSGTRHAVKAFQHDHDLREDGVAGPGTLKAIEAQLKTLEAQAMAAPAAAWPLLNDGQHPGNGFYKQALAGLEKINVERGIPSDQYTCNAAGTLASAACQSRFRQIDLVAVSDNGDKLIAVQGTPGAAHSKVIDVQTVVALNTPLAQSSQAFAEAHNLQQNQQSQQQVNRPVQTQTGPALA
ncbi:XVIPCD domain-containing protein [Variovorax sp. ZT4R33]|uniref:XVIPCD domain-containing protein n=1 Tax=Variovorax sp. ZT4R33 TaxID=3443743 RepID=UPI003F461627